MSSQTLLKLSKRDQVLNIFAELARARHWQDDRAMQMSSFERALGLLDVLLSDKKWTGNFLQLLTLREMIARAYLGEETAEHILNVL